MPRSARALAGALAAAALLVLPAAAVADDAAMKAGVAPALQALVPKEQAVVTAMRKVARQGRPAVPEARRKARKAARAAEVFAGLMLGQRPSSERGKKVKRLLLRGLSIEQRGYTRLDKALRAYQRGSEARASRLLRESSSRLSKAYDIGRRAGKLLSRL